MGQELWLSEYQLKNLSDLGVQFVARSGMENAVSSGILRGRPFGGVSIAWSPNLNHAITPLTNYKHHRVVGIELHTAPSPIIFISVYMPYFNASKRQECILETIDCISILQAIISDHPDHHFIIGGDFNTEFKNVSPLDCHWVDFISHNDMKLCDSFVSSPINYTYFHDSLGQMKWNDHFLMSRPLCSSTSGHVIMEAGDNPSDHHPIMMNLSVSLFPAPTGETTSSASQNPTLKWNMCNERETMRYTELLDEILLNNPSNFECTECHCRNNDCRTMIQNEYDIMIQSIKAADSVLPRQKPGTAKAWWSKDLQNLKQKSIEITEIWKSEGRPRDGQTNRERLKVRAEYRRAIKSSKTNKNQKSWDKMHEHLVTKDTDQFWRSWKKLHNKNNTHFHPVVNGISSKNGIAESFKNHFVKHSKPNDEQRVDELNQKFKDQFDEFQHNHIGDCNCDSYCVTLSIIVDSIFSMKKGKSCDDDGIFAEHFFNAPWSLFLKLQNLVNAMLRHGFVPKQFCFGTIVPIVKDPHGNLGDTDNYRGITISPISSKILEHTLHALFSDCLKTSNLQFGFKKNSSTSSAIFTLKETINYYSEHGSSVYCSFLDASKAFDRLVHSGLFLKLISRKAPLIFIEIIVFWYGDFFCRVRWDGEYSAWFRVKAGVRQGGILSPGFYSIYIDDLIPILMSLNVGCYIRKAFVAAICYADDMALVSPSLKGLQKLLLACESYCKTWDICLNPKKSKCMFFGKRKSSLCNLKLNGHEIEWTNKWPYLGVVLLSGPKFGCCISDKIKKFYRASNGILRIDGKSNDMTMLRLIESHCIPILTYGVEVIHVADADTRRQLRVAYNSVFRRIFNYRPWQSVRELQSMLVRPTWEEMIEKRTNSFLCRTRENVFVNGIFSP